MTTAMTVIPNGERMGEERKRIYDHTRGSDEDDEDYSDNEEKERASVEDAAAAAHYIQKNENNNTMRTIVMRMKRVGWAAGGRVGGNPYISQDRQ